MRFVKPLDGALLERIAARFNRVITIEDNTVLGGFGSAVAEYYASRRIQNVSLHMHGLPDRFIDHGSPAELAAETGLDSAGIVRLVRTTLDHPVSTTAG